MSRCINKLTNDQILEIVADGIAGKQTTEIMNKFQISRTRVLRIFKKNNLPAINYKFRQWNAIESNVLEIIKMYESGIRGYQIQKIFKITDSTLTKILKENNIPRRYDLPRISEEIKKEILKKYANGDSARKIARDLKISHYYDVTPFLHKNNVEMFNHKYKINEKFLDTLSPEIAYWLGYFFADGCISEYHRKNSIKKTITIALNVKDDHILHRFANIIAPEENQYDMVKYYDKFDKKYNILRRQAVLAFGNKLLVNKLEELGCGPRKSLTLKFIPILEQKLDECNTFFHFLRGVTDGDGCIFINQKNQSAKKIVAGKKIKCTWQFIGSNDFVKSIKEKLKSILNIECFIKTKNKVSTLHLYKSADVCLLLKNIYNESSIHLDRKYQKWILFRDQFEKESQ